MQTAITSAAPPSREALELAKLVGMVIDEYREKVPDVKPHDIRQALEIAIRDSGTGTSAAMLWLVGVLLAAVGLVGVVVAMNVAGQLSDDAALMAGVGVLVGGLLVGVVVMRNRDSQQ